MTMPRGLNTTGFQCATDRGVRPAGSPFGRFQVSRRLPTLLGWWIVLLKDCQGALEPVQQQFGLRDGRGIVASQILPEQPMGHCWVYAPPRAIARGSRHTKKNGPA
jgi:hypothetical protein